LASQIRAKVELVTPPSASPEVPFEQHPIFSFLVSTTFLLHSESELCIILGK
jgi:hypothetical protein